MPEKYEVTSWKIGISRHTSIQEHLNWINSEHGWKLVSVTYLDDWWTCIWETHDK